MEASYVHKDSTTLEEKPQVFTRWIDPTIKELKQENQELKEKIDGIYEERTYLYNKLSTEKEQLNSLVNSCQEEIRQLKKQLEDMTLCRDIASGHRKEVQDRETILLNQQKEFIKYLEDESKEIYRDGGLRQNIFRQILQKYKSIIGVLDEKSNNISS